MHRTSPSRLLAGAFLLLLVTLPACKGCGPQPPTPDGGVILPIDGAVAVWGTVVGPDESALAGVQVFLGEASTVTDADGQFLLKVDAVGAVSLLVRAEGFLRAERRVVVGDRPIVHVGTIMVFPLGGQATLDGATGGSVSGGAVTVEVPGGAFTGSVEVEVAEIPVDDPLLESIRLPARIPTPRSGAVSPLFAFVLEASGQQPTVALAISVVPPVALPEGLQVPVGRFDVDQAAWVDAAVGTVDAGGLVTFTIDHLSTFAAALPALPDDPAPRPDLDTLTRISSLFPPGEPRVEPKSGALQVGVPLPPLVRRGATQSLTLFHDSRTVGPELEVSVSLPDAPLGALRGLEVNSPFGSALISATVGARATEELPAMVTTQFEVAPVVFENVPRLTEGEPRFVETGSHWVTVEVFEPGPAMLFTSGTASFTTPEAASPVTLEGIPVPAPTPVAVRNIEERPVAVDNRSASPFGPGWHLRGLTRLVQPSCNPAEITLAGGFEEPATTFGNEGTLFLSSIKAELVAAGVPEADLETPPRLAFLGGSLFVGVQALTGASIWQLVEGEAPVLVAGGGTNPGGVPSCNGGAVDLYLSQLTGLDAMADGLIFSTEDCIFRLGTDGNLTHLAGQPAGGGQPAGPGVPIEQVDFIQHLMSVVSGQSGKVWFFETLLQGPFLSREGILEQIRTRGTATPGGAFAIRGDDTLFYQHPGAACAYQHVDGLSDPELFPRCLEGVPTTLVDGPAAEATVGEIAWMRFDETDDLWFIDSTFQALRKLNSQGVVSTISGGEPGALIGIDGPAEAATLGPVSMVAAGGSRELAVSGDGSVLRLQAIPEGELEELGSSDGSVLRSETDGSYTRTLSDGRIERYDDRGVLLSRGGPGEPPVEYHYAAWADPLAEVICGHPVPPPRLEEITLSGEALFSFSYDGDRVYRIRDAAGRETVLTWEAQRPGRILPVEGEHSFRYDTNGWITEHRRPGPNGGGAPWTYTYEDGRLVSAQVPGRGLREWKPAVADTTVPESEFSAAGVARDVLAEPAMAERPTASGGVAKVAVGKDALELTDPAGNETGLELDPLGRVTRRRQADGSTVSLSRDAAGRIVELLNEETGDRWSFEHHAATGHLTSRTDPAGRTVSFLYDPEGHLRSRRTPGSAVTTIENASSGAARGLPTRVVDPIGRETLIEYDAHGNSSRYLFPGDVETLVERDAVGRAVRVVRPDGSVELTEYDAFGGITAQSWGEEPTAPTTTYERVVTGGWEEVGSHLPASALVSATDAAGRSWSWGRDATLMPSAILTPAGGEVRQLFDAEGRRISRSLDDTSSETFAYDLAGRLERRSWSGPAAGASLSMRYDELGRIDQLSDPLMTETRTFTPGVGWSGLSLGANSSLGAASSFQLGRSRMSFAASRQELGGSLLTLHRGFDEKVERVEFQQTTPPLVSVHDVLTFSYDASRNLVGIDRGNGTHTQRTLDAEGRVIRQEEMTPSGTTTIDWTYDAAGRPSTRTLNGTTRTYGYTALGRLRVCTDTGETFTYDAVGARSSFNTSPYQRDAGGRLQSAAGTTYSYDALGRRTLEDPTAVPAARQRYRWGPGGRLAEVLRGAAGSEVSLARFEYDGSGRRILQTTAAGEWRYGYLPDTDRLVRVVDPAGTVWHLVHALPDAAYTLAVSDAGDERYVHTDPFSRVLGISDAAGNLELLDEDCYGQRLTPAAIDGPSVGFHGQVFDAATGLYGSGARTYDPVTGEFLSPDPAGIEASADLFGYAGGNPVIQADPGGRFVFMLAGALLAGGMILKEIKDFSESESVKKTRRSYEKMTDLDDDDDLAEAERAHERLHKASDEGGDTAIRCTKRAIEAVTDPVDDADGLKDALKEAAEEFSGDSEGDSGGDDSWF